MNLNRMRKVIFGLIVLAYTPIVLTAWEVYFLRSVLLPA